MPVNLTDPIFHSEDAAREHFETIRWPFGPVCPHCGTIDQATRLEGKAHRPGVWTCRACDQQFTVMVGSVMESSHLPLTKWALAFFLMAGSKKGVSAHQLHRSLKITYKTAWFLAHRVREAMTDPKPAPLGGEGKVIEADEAYHGKRETPAQRSRNARTTFTKGGKSGGAQKRPIVALVERGGEVRAFHMPTVNANNIREKLVTHASRKSRLHTDESNLYTTMGEEFAKHETVNHGKKEYARGDVTTNSVEGFFGIVLWELYT